MDFSDDAVPIAELLDERRHLLDVAMWMVGGRAEAESVVDEAYRQWFELPEAARGVIESPGAWLVRTVGGICLARLTTSAGGTGPAVASPARPVVGLELEQEIGEVLLTALDALSPAERAAFVLNGCFGLSLGAVADVVGRSEPECAELAERARRTISACRSHPVTPEEHDAVARAVGAACVSGDAVRLSSLMCPDVTAFFDGGGKLRALVRPVHGAEPVARSLMTLLAHHQRVTLSTHSVNGRTGLVARYEGQVVAVVSLDVADGRVSQAWIVLNPDKLRPWNHPARTGRRIIGS
ncbi:sigma factor-like helix-turn-helix DNA-binding protein [Actinacidiphila sp. bgisy160]|uniref:sigma factor-like helix-turn-helix DNA-binding protein n=1 Tax=Actinacidiphila sp. bgisy160 TaxID=3413796 RepID=UPI003D764F27